MHSLPFERTRRNGADERQRRGCVGERRRDEERRDRGARTGERVGLSSMLEEKFISKRPRVTVKKSVSFSRIPSVYPCTRRSFIYSPSKTCPRWRIPKQQRRDRPPRESERERQILLRESRVDGEQIGATS